MQSPAASLFLDVLTLVAQNGFVLEAEPFLGLCKSTWTDVSLAAAVCNLPHGPLHRTRLMYAAHTCRLSRLRFLLSSGADPNRLTAAGWLVASACGSQRHFSIKGTWNAPRYEPRSALYYACESSSQEGCVALLRAGARQCDGPTAVCSPLLLACRVQHPGIVRALLAAKQQQCSSSTPVAAAPVIDLEGAEALLQACGIAHSPLLPGRQHYFDILQEPVPDNPLCALELLADPARKHSILHTLTVQLEGAAFHLLLQACARRCWAALLLELVHFKQPDPTQLALPLAHALLECSRGSAAASCPSPALQCVHALLEAGAALVPLQPVLRAVQPAQYAEAFAALLRAALRSPPLLHLLVGSAAAGGWLWSPGQWHQPTAPRLPTLRDTTLHGALLLALCEGTAGSSQTLWALCQWRPPPPAQQLHLSAVNWGRALCLMHACDPKLACSERSPEAAAAGVGSAEVPLLVLAPPSLDSLLPPPEQPIYSAAYSVTRCCAVLAVLVREMCLLHGTGAQPMALLHSPLPLSLGALAKACLQLPGAHGDYLSISIIKKAYDRPSLTPLMLLACSARLCVPAALALMDALLAPLPPAELQAAVNATLCHGTSGTALEMAAVLRAEASASQALVARLLQAGADPCTQGLGWRDGPNLPLAHWAARQYDDRDKAAALAPPLLLAASGAMEPFTLACCYALAGGEAALEGLELTYAELLGGDGSPRPAPVDARGWSVLMHVCAASDLHRHPARARDLAAAAELLVAMSPDVLTCQASGGERETALSLACDSDEQHSHLLVVVLLQPRASSSSGSGGGGGGGGSGSGSGSGGGEDPLRAEEGERAYLHAARRGRAATIRALAAAGVPGINARDLRCQKGSGRTALMTACTGGHADAVQALLECGADMFARAAGRAGKTAKEIVAAECTTYPSARLVMAALEAHEAALKRRARLRPGEEE